MLIPTKPGMIAVCLLAASFGHPEWPAGAPRQGAQPSFKTRVEVVALNVTVTDHRGRAVAGLARDDFAVFEDGVPQRVSFFGDGTIPIDLVLLIDTSASMREKLQVVRKAAQGFISALRPTDRGAVVAFSDSLEIVQPSTGSRDDLLNSLQLLRAQGGTALYTALYVTLTDLSRRDTTARQARRSAIVVLTDGEDSRSLTAYEDLEQMARRANVVVYPISVISTFAAEELTRNRGRRFLGPWEHALNAVARETGGRAFFPVVIQDLAGIYDDIAQELAMQYSLGYESTRVTLEAAYRRILVQIPAHPDVQPRTRTGYYAGQGTSPMVSGGDPGKSPSR